MRGFTSRFPSRLLRVTPHVIPSLTLSLALFCGAFIAMQAHAQVFTVTPEGIEGKYLDFQPTNVPLSTAPLTNHNREDLLRFLQSEQGFAMRPLPVSTITLHANGSMQPSGSDYANSIRDHGVSAKAGGRVVITDVRIEKDRIILDFNGGPEHKHKWLRHVSIGMDPNATTPVVRDEQQTPTGSRIVLIFPHAIPDVTGLQAEALIKPIVDFNLKTPVQAYADTLPPAIRKSVQDHHVLVGMNTDMVLSALGQPKTKMREVDGKTPFEEWIYGDPPQPVQFVRINGNRVIRVEIANFGETPIIRTQNEMGDYWSTQPDQNTRIVKLGDQAPPKPGTEAAPKAPPSLRTPGEKLPADSDPTKPQMGPVQFPTDSKQGTGQPPAATPSQPPASQPAMTQPSPNQMAPSQLTSDTLIAAARPGR